MDIKANNNESSINDNKDNVYNELIDKTNDFCKINFDNLNNYEKWSNFYKDYDNLYNKISEFEKKFSEVFDKRKNLDDKYKKSIIEYNKWNNKQIENVEKRIEKSQFSSLGAFSVFMTLLTFVLTNIVLGKEMKMDFKNLIIFNLILLSVSTSCFIFIGIFLNALKFDNCKNRIISIILLFLPIFIFILMIILYKYL